MTISELIAKLSKIADREGSHLVVVTDQWAEDIVDVKVQDVDMPYCVNLIRYSDLPEKD